jgi:hypothetical protein
VKYSTETAMVLQIPGDNPETIFMTHEVGHPYTIRNRAVVPFLKWIKSGFSDVFKSNDWVLAGHCHTTVLSVKERVGCIGQFSPEAKAAGYGILTIDDRISIDLRNEKGARYTHEL